MPVSTDTDLLINAFRIEDKDFPIGVWLYYDTTTELLRTTRVNTTVAYLGDFLRSPMTPSEIFVRQIYPSLGFALDFVLGSKTTVSSQRRGLLPVTITANNIFVYYKPPQLTDIFTFTIYSTDNSLNKSIVMPITISPVDVVPTNIQGNPTINTLNNKYTGLTMLFSEGGVDAGVVTTSSSQSSVSNVSFSNGTCTFDYTTPTTDTSDSIIFTSCKAADIQYVNASPYTFEIKNLLKEPNFSNWLVTPASQSFPYTNSDSLVAVFNKDIKTCTSITATSGSPLTIIPISIMLNKVTFEWTSLTTGSVNFTFNGLESMDGSIDANVNGLIAVGPILLNTPPIIVGWTGSQPTEENTLYNLSVLFNKELSNSRTPIITATDGITPVFTSISGSQVNFTVTTSSNPSTTVYTLKNIAALDGSIKYAGLNISAGAKIISVQVETDLSGSYLEMSSLVIERPQKVKIILSKPISGVLSFVPNDENCAFGVVTMINDFTAQLTITPVNNGNTSLVIQTNNIITLDGSQSVLSRTFSLVYSQTILNLYESSNKNVVKTTFDIGTLVALSLQVSKPISSDLSDTTITCSNGTVSNVSQSTINNKYYYNFDFTPTTPSTNQIININRAKDLSNFKYNLSQSNLIFVIPYAYPTSFTISGTLQHIRSSSLTLLFSGGDGFHSNIVSEQISYVKYIQGTTEIIFTNSNLSCSANTISIGSITPFSLQDLIIKVVLLAPNGRVGPEISSTVLANAILPQWVPTSAGSIASNIPSPHKLVVGSTCQLTFSFNSATNFPSTDATTLFILRVNNGVNDVLTSLTGAFVDISLCTIRISYTISAVETTTFKFSTVYGTNYIFSVLSSEVYTFPTMVSTSRNVSFVSLNQTLTLTSNFSSAIPTSATNTVSILPTGYSTTISPTTIISDSRLSITYSVTVEYDVSYSGTIKLLYGAVQREYSWNTDTLTSSNIYTFPSTFTYSGTLRQSTSSSLTLTFTTGDKIHSSLVANQIEYVKFSQSGGEDTTINTDYLSCSDPLETITISSITPTSTSDLTIKVKLRGPDGVLSSDISVVIPSAQIESLSNVPVSGLIVWLDGSDPLGTGIEPAENTTITSWVDKSGSNKHCVPVTTGQTVQVYKSGNFNSSTIITSNLALLLDAGNRSSYPGYGTLWTDLSGNGNNGTLTNGPTYSNANSEYIIFDGSNDIVTGTIASSTFTGPHTISCWFYRTAGSSWTALFSNSVGVSGGSMFCFAGDPNTLTVFQLHVAGNTLAASVNLGSDHLNQWIYATIVYSGVTTGSAVSIYAYKNGTLLTGTGSLYWNISPTSAYQIGKFDTGANFKGYISHISVYNRILTSSEINQNYNSLKGRYFDTGIKKGSVFFPGNVGVARIPFSSNTFPYTSYTISVMCKVTSYDQPTNGGIVSGPTDPPYILFFGMWSNTFQIFNHPHRWAGNMHVTNVGTNRTFTINNTWAHLCMAYSGGIMRPYVNGVAMNPVISEQAMTSDPDIKIGGNGAGIYRLTMNMAELRIYNVALNGVEVANLNSYLMEKFVNLTKIITPGLVIFIAPNKSSSYSGSGSTLINLASGGGTGTINGSYESVTILGKRAIHLINTNSNVFSNISTLFLPIANVQTISIWYYITSLTFGYILDGRKTTSETYINAYYGQIGSVWSNAIFYFNGGLSQPISNIQTCFNSVSSSWQHITIVATNVQASIIFNLFAAYYNGSSNQGIDINIGNVYAYNRALTHFENSSNYLLGSDAST
jgi:hypothetical protein